MNRGAPASIERAAKPCVEGRPARGTTTPLAGHSLHSLGRRLNGGWSRRAQDLALAALVALLAVLPAEAADAPLRGQLRAKRQAVLSAGLAGEVEKMAVREGERVAEGALIAAIDCSPQHASKRVAEAKLSAAVAKQKSNQRLAELHQSSVLEVEVARAEAAMAAAELAALGANLKKCELHAPFSGIVVAQPGRQNQYVREGDPLVELMDVDGLEVEMVLPSRWLEWLKPGTGFEMAVDEVRRSVPARVDRIGGRVDPISQTVRVLGRIEGKQPDLLPGMSGSLIFPGKP